MDLTQRQALADLLRTKPAYDSPLAALVGDASANVRAGVGTAQAVTPSWRQKTAGLLQDGIEALGAGRYRARRIAETLAGGESSNLPMRMGLLDPTMIGAAFGRQESPNMGPGAPSGLMHAATVFHGSPHKFDKFDSRKIGTGEGAQAYGHGLYLAESPDVARAYQSTLGAGNYVSDPAYQTAVARKDRILGRLSDRYGISDEDTLRGMMASGEATGVPPVVLGALGKADQKVSSAYAAADKGSLYSVDLPDDKIARMLDWDKPLSQQSRPVRVALSPKVVQRDGGWFVDEGPKKGTWKYSSKLEALSEANAARRSRDLTGEVIHERINMGRDAETAQALRAAGIPGIRYLDGQSRGAGGTSNFVVFPGEESALRILTRNGAPLP